MTSPAPVFAPTAATYATRIPYITSAEYQQAATGVDSNNLVPNGTSAAQAAALKAIIGRASAWVDNLCYQVLAATRDMQSGRYRVRRDGTIAVPLDYSPVIAIAGASVGALPNNLVALSDLSSVAIDRKVVTLPATASGSSGNPVPYYDSRVLTGGHVFALVSYVNGYANTLTTAAAAAGTSSITVASPLAIFPGMTLTIADADKTEQVTVAATFAPSVTIAPTAIPLAAPLLSAHATGTPVGALPESIKEAAILLTSALIKTRGGESYEMPTLGQQPNGHMDNTESHGLEDVDVAIDLLEPFRRAA